MSIMHGWRPLAMDGALAAVLAAMLVATVLVTPGAGPLDLAAVLVGSLALVAWRRAPLAALLVTAACMLFYSVHAHPGPPAAFPVLVTVFSAVRAGHLLVTALVSAVFLSVSLAADLATPTGHNPQDIVQSTSLLLGWFLAAGVTATVTRHRQAYLEQAEQRATEAERTREEAALRRAGEERLRIARELHDSLTHSISIIKVQAGVAVHLARKRGEDVPAALLAIQEASGDAMRELRATLEVLRNPETDPESDAVPSDAEADVESAPKAGAGVGAESGSGPGSADGSSPGSADGTGSGSGDSTGSESGDGSAPGSGGGSAPGSGGGSEPGSRSVGRSGTRSGPSNGSGNGADSSRGEGSGGRAGGGSQDSRLDRLDELVRRARSTGLPATVTISGVRQALPAEVDRAAYRIVQEALTNVSRHAGGAAAAVRIEYGGAELVVQVDDDGLASADAPPVPGVGLVGMRERVTALGGRLRAEPRPEGGFTVRAELPLGRSLEERS
jgi:signal transduction histidine kinase